MTLNQALITVAFSLSTFFLGYTAAKVFHQPTPSTASAPNQSPQFKVKDCLAPKHREAWEPEVWAEILQVGKKAYLLDLQPYKRRSKFADVAATPLDFELIEHTMERTECPERAWIREGLPHENKGTWVNWASR